MNKFDFYKDTITLKNFCIKINFAKANFIIIKKISYNIVFLEMIKIFIGRVKNTNL
jgi:hypothetical protein